jgi:Holliday junction resolvase
MNSRAKGKAGELELAKFFREHGFDEARRGVQFRGGGDSPDVIGLPGFHVECKRVEAGNLYSWLDQATRDADGTGRVPLVAHRRNRREWVAILPLDHFLRILRNALYPDGEPE